MSIPEQPLPACQPCEWCGKPVDMSRCPANVLYTTLRVVCIRCRAWRHSAKVALAPLGPGVLFDRVDENFIWYRYPLGERCCLPWPRANERDDAVRLIVRYPGRAEREYLLVCVPKGRDGFWLDSFRGGDKLRGAEVHFDHYLTERELWRA